jgi:hypothetical protein
LFTSTIVFEVCHLWIYPSIFFSFLFLQFCYSHNKSWSFDVLCLRFEIFKIFKVFLFKFCCKFFMYIMYTKSWPHASFWFQLHNFLSCWRFNIFFCFHKFCCTIFCDFLGYGTLATTCKLFNSYFLVQLLKNWCGTSSKDYHFCLNYFHHLTHMPVLLWLLLKPHLNLILLYNVDPIHQFIYI